MRKAEKEKAERKQKRKKRKAAKDKEGKEEKKTVARFTKKEYSAHGAELAGLQLKTSSAVCSFPGVSRSMSNFGVGKSVS